MANEFLSAVIILSLVVDPFGNTPLVNAMLAGVPDDRRRIVIARECAIAFGLLIAFMFGGQSFLALMHLSETSLSIAGGVILFMIAIRMVFARGGSPFGHHVAGEPFIVPLAVPLIAGPSALATVMLMATREPGKIGMWAAAITVTMAVTAVILLAGVRLQRWLGEHAMQAIERLMGLILTAIAVEMLLTGIRAFVKGL
jgi:MarC family membrane protein